MKLARNSCMVEMLLTGRIVDDGLSGGHKEEQRDGGHDGGEVHNHDPSKSSRS